MTISENGGEQTPDEDKGPPSPVTGKDLLKMMSVVQVAGNFVVIPLFIKKSDGNSAVETVFLIAVAEVALVLIVPVVVGLRYFGRTHCHGLAWIWARPSRILPPALAGSFLLVMAFQEIDATETAFVEARDPGEYHAETGGVALVNLAVGNGESSSRLVATVVNTRLAPVMVHEGFVSVRLDGPMRCSSEIVHYRLDDVIHVESGRIDGLIVQGGTGVLASQAVPVRGSLTQVCDETWLTVSFPLPLTLEPQETTSVAFDLPHTIHAVRQLRDAPEAVEPESVQLNFSVFEQQLDHKIVAAIAVKSGKRVYACAARRLDMMAAELHATEFDEEPCPATG